MAVLIIALKPHFNTHCGLLMKRRWIVISSAGGLRILLSPTTVIRISVKNLQHVRRMDRSRLPHAIIEYRPAGTRNPERPLKRLLDGYTEAGMGHKA
jgi:hypothetical protein